MRMKDKKVIIVGAGQSPGEGIGNGRAAAILMAREGAEILSVDRDLGAAEETAALIRKEQGNARAYQADVTREADMKAMIDEASASWGRIDVLHYNVGVSLAGGDKSPLEITERAFDNVNAINLRGFVMAVKHALPVLRSQKSGVILAVSSVAALSASYITVAYKTSKSGMIAFRSRSRARTGIRSAPMSSCPAHGYSMAVDTRAREWGSRAPKSCDAQRESAAQSQDGYGLGLGYAALFRSASDEAKFITGVALRARGRAVRASD